MRLYFLPLLLLLAWPFQPLNAQLPRHLQIAYSFKGVKEATGNNDGPIVEWIIKRQGGSKGSSYCAYFVGMCIDSAGAIFPKPSGMAIGYKKSTSIKASDVLTGKKVPVGSIVIFRKGDTIFGHTGFVKSWNKASGITIEGNTSNGNTGSQWNGGGIYERRRSILPSNYFRITNFTEVKY